MRTGRWAYIVSLTVLLARATVQAQAAPDAQLDPQSASAQLEAGETAYAQGGYGDALDCFEASYRMRGEAQTLRRIGDAADKLGSHARAIEALKSYLVRVPDTRDRVFIQSRIDANQAALDSVRQQGLAPASSAKVLHDSKALQSSAMPAAALTQTKAERSDNPAGPLWLWATGGAVVVAGIVIAAVVISSGASSGRAEPVRGNVGSAIQTLTF